MSITFTHPPAIFEFHSFTRVRNKTKISDYNYSSRNLCQKRSSRKMRKERMGKNANIRIKNETDKLK